MSTAAAFGIALSVVEPGRRFCSFTVGQAHRATIWIRSISSQMNGRSFFTTSSVRGSPIIQQIRPYGAPSVSLMNCRGFVPR